jgi:hypothetical protein
MKRTITTVLLAGGATVLLAGPAAAQPISEPASCQGYLSSWANPNMGFLVHTLRFPQAAALGVTPGAIVVSSAQAHDGGLEPCIPE